MGDPIYISPSAKIEPKYTPWWTTGINSLMNQIYQKVVGEPINRVFNENDQEAIGSALGMMGIGGPGATSSQAFMPALGKNNPRIQELYKKLVGLYPYGKVAVYRKQFEDPSVLTSHESRGGIFVTPLKDTSAVEGLIPPTLKNRDELKEVQTYVNLTNPLLTFQEPLVGRRFGNETFLRELIGGRYTPDRHNDLYLKLLKKARKNLEAGNSSHIKATNTARDMVLPDLAAAIMANRNNVDALIAAQGVYPKRFSRNSTINEIMLLPDSKEHDLIMRKK